MSDLGGIVVVFSLRRSVARHRQHAHLQINRQHALVLCIYGTSSPDVTLPSKFAHRFVVRGQSKRNRYGSITARRIFALRLKLLDQ